MVLIATTWSDYQVTSLRIKTTSIFMGIENFSILTILLRTVGQWGYRDFRRLNIFAKRRKRRKKGKWNQTSALQVQTLAAFALNPGPKHEASCLTNTQKCDMYETHEKLLPLEHSLLELGLDVPWPQVLDATPSCPLSLEHCKVGKWLLSVQVWEMLQSKNLERDPKLASISNPSKREEQRAKQDTVWPNFKYLH